MPTQPARKWASTYPCGSFRRHATEDAAWEQAQTDAADGASSTTIYFNDGAGWELYERVDHAGVRGATHAR